MGNGKSCLELGLLYIKGHGVEQDTAKALEYYEKACDLGLGEGGMALGVLYANGQDTLRQDYTRAKTYFERACDLGDGRGCYVLGTIYEDGGIVKQDMSKAKELYGKACDLGSQNGCDAYEEIN